MKRLYDKNKLTFTLVWIAAYALSFSLADKLSSSVGIAKSITAPLGVAFVAVMAVFVVKSGLREEFGLCSFKGSYKGVLFFIPLIPILALYLWNGVHWSGSLLEAALSVAAMLCVGFIEEMLFRGFLFNALREDNETLAVLISSLTFGLGHIVNLLNGRDLIPTLLQMCYAMALGFLLTMLVCKGKSLLPGVMLHGVLNVLSLFNGTAPRTQSMIASAALCVISVAYALWIRRPSEDSARKSV